MRLKFYQNLLETGLLPLFYEQNAEKAFQIAAACHRGGARAVEFTNRGDWAHEVFSELRKRAKKELPDLFVGAGSIADGPTAALFLQNGADFLVSPALREDVALVCNRRKTAYLPGCLTVTEIGRAEELGCEIIKIFPAETVGPEFIRAVRGPQPWSFLMPTGGVEPTETSLGAWFSAGAAAVGMGSKLIDPKAVASSDFLKIERDVRAVFELIKKVKKG